jgi:hypothetical protein
MSIPALEVQSARLVLGQRGAKLLAGLGESSTKHVFTKTAVVVATVTGDVGVGSNSEVSAF